ncbi:MAG: L-glutamate gamma-semialdehyde dehydrogenase [Saprospiraceae bacterium]|nr:L-glutamate gamma-semialdehyde dehydrogenase [Saprospiraceae bacterium]
MPNGLFKLPEVKNEPILTYLPGSKEKLALKESIKFAKSQELEIYSIINGKEVKTGDRKRIHPPHEINHTLGHYYKSGPKEVEMAIDAALAAKASWESMDWQDRAAIFLKAADLMAGPYRSQMSTATMLGQSKNVYQAEIDCICELVDFLRFNVHFMSEIYKNQPYSPAQTWNKVEYRALEGFVFALTPFNFTAIAGNLPTAPAMMGNTVVWKPSETQIYSAHLLMKIFQEAGLPDGVINLVYVGGADAGKVIFSHPAFAGIHYTGSTEVFQQIWKTIGDHIHTYHSYPRIVGETGGKDYVIAHPSADPKAVAVGLTRGAFEFQGQKCSAASRAYIPQSLWPEVLKYMKEDLAKCKMGTVEDFTNFINAVIDEKSFDKIMNYISNAKNDPSVEIVIGGKGDKTQGYFIEPTVILTKDPYYKTMCEEIFGPVLTIFVYQDQDFFDTLEILNKTSPYALTGALFAKDRNVIVKASEILRHTAGNFYINDKPTGAVVHQQPFGGGRASGTNDKAGSSLNLMRWVSARTMKENFVSPTDFSYPFMLES